MLVCIHSLHLLPACNSLILSNLLFVVLEYYSQTIRCFELANYSLAIVCIPLYNSLCFRCNGAMLRTIHTQFTIQYVFELHTTFVVPFAFSICLSIHSHRFAVVYHLRHRAIILGIVVPVRDVLSPYPWNGYITTFQLCCTTAFVVPFMFRGVAGNEPAFDSLLHLLSWLLVQFFQLLRLFPLQLFRCFV